MILHMFSFWIFNSVILQNLNYCSTEITGTHATRRPYMDDKRVDTLERELWRFTSQGRTSCLGYCTRDTQCVGVFYNKVTSQCQGHSITFGDISDAVVDVDSRYYIRPHGEQYIGDACASSADCVTSNSECRLSVCMCVPGYSFSPKTYECLQDCDTYGPDYLEVRDYFVSKSNMEDVTDLTIQECLTFCNNRTEYTCRSLEYSWTSRVCYLQNVTKLHHPDRWFSDFPRTYDISYFQRDCDL